MNRFAKILKDDQGQHSEHPDMMLHDDLEHGGFWSGHPCPEDPDNFWIDDETGECIPAA